MPDALAKGPLRLHKLPPLWGSPSPSPFVIKLETWLRMASIPYQSVYMNGPPRSKNRKIPYVTLPSGEVLADSSLIIERLTADHRIELDVGLDPRQQAVAHAVRRLVEDSLYFIGLYERWVGAGYADSARGYFAHMAFPIRLLLPRVIHARMRRVVQGQGVGRYSDAERAAKAQADIRAVGAILGDQEFMLGRPSSVDATVFGFSWAMTVNPYPSAAGDAFKADPRIVGYLQRMRQRYWADWSAESDVVPFGGNT